MTTSVATNTLVYDGNGNLLTNGTRIFEYDDENRLVAMTEPSAWRAEFIYDGAHRRRIQRDYAWWGSAWSQTNETRLIYDGNRPIQHRDGNNLPVLTFTRGNDLSGTLEGAGGIGGLLAMEEHSADNPQRSTSIWHCDGNGNVTCLVGTNQLVLARYHYGPFGQTLSLSGPKAAVNPYRFSSKPVHELSGTYDYLRRWYDPSLQRWLTRDPIEELGGVNLYGFLGNSAVADIDAYGLWNLWNPATWGNRNALGWSVGNSLAPWHESSGYTWEGIKQTSLEADAAFWDGVIPFWDPYSDLYDPCDKSLEWSKRIGEYTRNVELALAGARLARFRGPEYGQWKEAGQSKQGWHGHLDWGSGLGKHHLPQQTGNFLKNLRAVIKRWWDAP